MTARSICPSRLSRSYMRDIGLLSRIVPLLQHSNVKLLTRAVGVRGTFVTRPGAHHRARRLCTTCRATAAASPASVMSKPCPCSFTCSRCCPPRVHSGVAVPDDALPSAAAAGSCRCNAMGRRRSSPYAAARRGRCRTCRGSIFLVTLSGASWRFSIRPRFAFSLAMALAADPERFELISSFRCSGIEPLIDLLFGSDIASQVCVCVCVCVCV
jgi:hypothetical protein